MGELTIKYEDLQSIADNANTLASKAEEYVESLQNDVVNTFSGVTAGVNDILESAQYYVVTKQNQLASKATEYYTFAVNVGNLIAHAKEADKDVATKIENNQEDFLKKNSDIKAAEGIDAFLINLFVEVKNACPLFEIVVNITVAIFDELGSELDALKYFYECGGGKEICQIIGAAILVVASVAILLAAFPVSLALTLEGIVSMAALVSGVIGLVNSGFNLTYSVIALDSRQDGDPAWAKIYGDTDKASDSLRLTNFDSKLGNTLSYLGADAIDTVEFVTDCISIGNMSKNLLKKGIGEGWTKVFTGGIKGFKPEPTKMLDDIKGVYNTSIKGGFRLTKESSKYYKALGLNLKTLQKDFDVAVGLFSGEKSFGDAFGQYWSVSRNIQTSSTYKIYDKVIKTLDKESSLRGNCFGSKLIDYYF
ncbi:MAG: hypothetical protein K6D38_04965 [Pseudobutyrivibrio sp.]|nr:hypothetical protein [Pseudobutyrivibrio sp.]